MQAPTEHELRHLYDPVKAHEYYERTKKLKGRRQGVSETSSNGRRPSGQDSRTGKTRKEIAQGARARQRKELTTAIQSLQGRLQKLEARIRDLEQEEASEDRKSKAKKERAAKEREKPKTAAEKAEAVRESKKYREKHRQELKTEAKRDRETSGGGSTSDTESESKTESISQLKTLATKVKGKIAVAKQKLAAL